MTSLQNLNMRSLKNDIMLFFVMIAIGVLLLLIFENDDRTAGDKAVISIDGKTYGEYPLDKDDTFTIETERGTNIINIENGQVSVTGADCADKICVEHEPIGYNRQTIVCLPHRLVIEIESKTEAYVDAVSE